LHLMVPESSAKAAVCMARVTEKAAIKPMVTLIDLSSLPKSEWTI
jgi:hypothetical protein